MHRFAIFVDGSNLFGLLRALDVKVDDYDAFYSFVFSQAVETWRQVADAQPQPAAQLLRTYWYVLGDIDEWDLANPKAQAHLRDHFDGDADLKRLYMSAAGPKCAGQSQEKVALEAFTMCLNEARGWYESRKKSLDGMRRFYHAIRANTDFIDIIESGRWKVDILHRTVSEKGLDTSLAVDMVAQIANYDVAIVISGDADTIPSIQFAKSRGKHVGVIEFHKGYPPEKRGRGFASRLKLCADFVVHVYEMDLVSKGVGKKGADKVGTE